MSGNTPGQQAKGTSSIAQRIGWKLILRFFIALLIMPAGLFIAAGRMNWVMGWALTIILLAVTVTSRIAMMRNNPELIEERAHYGDRDNAKSWDRPIIPFVAVFGPLTWIVAGLDLRFGWSPRLPLAVQIAALALVIVGFLLGTWAMAVNRFFSAIVRIQEDRGHTVVTAGPYRYVRHPSYTGGILASLATALALSSLWALIPGGAVALVTIVRTALEDRTLQEELAGYKDYAQKVRYRLVPGIW
jgi:protein-S-isoprenylcysteine O-methyltransferase Ste14